MKPEKIKVSAVLPAAPRDVYEAWLNGEKHAAMTGSPATGSAKAGTSFQAWDGYISGKNLELDPPSRILQAWRTTEFPHDAPDSRLEVILEETKGGTRITLIHTDIPPGQSASYKQGWFEYYFAPMKEYFSGKG